MRTRVFFSLVFLIRFLQFEDITNVPACNCKLMIFTRSVGRVINIGNSNFNCLMFEKKNLWKLFFHFPSTALRDQMHRSRNVLSFLSMRFFSFLFICKRNLQTLTNAIEFVLATPLLQTTDAFNDVLRHLTVKY